MLGTVLGASDLLYSHTNFVRHLIIIHILQERKTRLQNYKLKLIFLEMSELGDLNQSPK